MKPKQWIMFLTLNIPIIISCVLFPSSIQDFLFQFVILQILLVSLWNIFTSVMPSTIGEIRQSYNSKSIDNSHSLVAINLTTKVAFLSVSIAGIAFLGIIRTDLHGSVLYIYSIMSYSLAFICFFISTDLYDSSKNTPYMQHPDRCLMLTKRAARIYQIGLTNFILAICSSIFLVNNIIGAIVTIIAIFLYTYYNRPTMPINGKKGSYLFYFFLSLTFCLAPYILFCFFWGNFRWNQLYLVNILLIVSYVVYGILIIEKNCTRSVNNVALDKKKGKLIIAIEGVDGVGKSTVCSELGKIFNAEIIKTPNKIFSKLREKIDGSGNQYLRLSLYETMITYLDDELSSCDNKYIILDRYWFSIITLFELLFNELDDKIKLEKFLETIRQSANRLPKPDIVVYLTCNKSNLESRLNLRPDKSDTDYYSLEYDFRIKADSIFEKYRDFSWITIDNSNTLDETINLILSTIIIKYIKVY